MKVFYLICALISVFAGCPPVYGQGKAFDVKQVRAAFKTAAGGYFDIVGDDLAGIESEKRPGAYWLVKVKARKPGHYAVKYFHKYNDPFYGDGENTINVRVGGNPCDRQPEPEAGVARLCLGDTAILPIRTVNRYAYSFDVKYTYEDPANSVPGKPSNTPESSGVINPLTSNLKFLGTKVHEMPHRSCCASTFEYYAVFEAVKPGKFNLGLSIAGTAKDTPGDVPAAFFGGGTPVVILEPGTPITYLIGREDTIDYADEKKFSSHSGGSFATNLLVLQPGDVISLRFLTITRDDRSTASADKAKEADSKLPAISKLPFFVNREWSYNAFIADYFRN